MALLLAENVGKTYGSNGITVEALKGVDFSVEEGEIVALMGPSGSGKTTLLTILGAMNPPSTGRLIVDDIDVYGLPAEKRADFRHEYLGFVFQELQLIPYLTARENVMLPLAISGRGRREQEEMAHRALERIGLGDKTKRLPNQLSGGEQGRVAIARALVNHPPIILADEPTGSLDSQTGEEVMKVLQGLGRDGLTVVVVTHNPDNERFVDRTVRIRDGRIAAEEAPPTLR
ncbi:MAG: ABC transporter ATP-binding protein [Chloroflexi bacterium]|nr:ABC transporter ATP-binding protein [Chloroflexota bacterium]